MGDAGARPLVAQVARQTFATGQDERLAETGASRVEHVDAIAHHRPQANGQRDGRGVGVDLERVDDEGARVLGGHAATQGAREPPAAGHQRGGGGRHRNVVAHYRAYAGTASAGKTGAGEKGGRALPRRAFEVAVELQGGGVRYGEHATPAARTGRGGGVQEAGAHGEEEAGGEERAET